MMRAVMLVSALVACAVATATTGGPSPNRVEQKCKAMAEKGNYPLDMWGQLNKDTLEAAFDSAGSKSELWQCSNYTTVKDYYCNPCEKLRKISDQYVNGECCPSYECVRDESNPCCGVSCKAESYDEAVDECNIIHKDNEIWNELSPYFGAMYAINVEPADPPRGKCCTKYKCEVNKAQLCENQIERTPCVTEATCPACYYAQQSEPTNVAEGKCCASIVCVRDDKCMCDQRDDQNCPRPTCDPDFEYEVVLAQATADSCCPTYTCQRNLNAICEAKQEAQVVEAYDGFYTGFNESSPQDICGPCQRVTKFKPANFAAGKCFPEWKCVPVEDKCCEVDRLQGVGEKALDGTDCTEFEPICDDECTSSEVVRPRNGNKGRCCDTYACLVNNTCVCERTDCLFTSANDFGEFYCANKGGPNTKTMYEVKTVPAFPAAGKCCPTYSCRETAQKKLRDTRVSKRKQKRAERRARKAAKSTVAPTARS